MNRSRLPIWALSSLSLLGPLVLYGAIALLDGATRGRFPTPLQGFVAAGPAALAPLLVFAMVGQARRGLVFTLFAFLFVCLLPVTLLLSEPAPPDRAGAWYGVMDVVFWAGVVPTGLFIKSVIATFGLLFQTRYIRLPVLDGKEPTLERWEIWVFVGWAIFAPAFIYWSVMLLWSGSSSAYPTPMMGLVAASLATFAPAIAYGLGGHERRGLKLTVPAWLLLAIVPAIAMAFAHLVPRTRGEYAGVVDAFVWAWGVPLGLFAEALWGAVDLKTILKSVPSAVAADPLPGGLASPL
jgi:hypothetical protein